MLAIRKEGVILHTALPRDRDKDKEKERQERWEGIHLGSKIQPPVEARHDLLPPVIAK